MTVEDEARDDAAERRETAAETAPVGTSAPEPDDDDDDVDAHVWRAQT
jgi:hypothetical protein